MDWNFVVNHVPSGHMGHNLFPQSNLSCCASTAWTTQREATSQTLVFCNRYHRESKTYPCTRAWLKKQRWIQFCHLCFAYICQKRFHLHIYRRGLLGNVVFSYLLISKIPTRSLFSWIPQEKRHICFDLSKSTCALGLKLRCVFIRFHPWWLLWHRRRRWLTEVTSKVRWVKHSFRWSLVSNLCRGSTVGHVLGKCFLVAIFPGSVCYKEAYILKKKKTKQRGDMDTPKWETDLFEAISCKKCCDLLNEWKYINAYLDTSGKYMEIYSNLHQIIIRIDSWGYKNGFIAGIHVEHDLWVIRRNKKNEAKVRSNSCYSYRYSRIGIMIPKLFCLSLI